MVAGLDKSVIQVDVSDNGIGSGVANEDPSVVMAVEFCGAIAGAFYTDSRAENAEMAEVGLAAVPCLKRRPARAVDNTSVV